MLKFWCEEEKEPLIRLRENRTRVSECVADQVWAPPAQQSVAANPDQVKLYFKERANA